MGWLRVVTLAVVAALSMGVAAQEQYQEGVHYELIEPAIHAGISDRVVVTDQKNLNPELRASIHRPIEGDLKTQ